MAVKFNLRLCLQLIDRGTSLNTISKQYHISKHTSSKTKHRMEVLQFDVSTIDQYLSLIHIYLEFDMTVDQLQENLAINFV